MTAFKNSVDIDFSATGDVTQELYNGLFTVKLFLSPMDNVKYFADKKALLPKDFKLDMSDDASVSVDNLAEALSALPIRIMSGPRWWSETGFGKTLLDINVLYELYAKVMSQVVEEINARKAKMQEQKKDLQKSVEQK